MERYVIHMLRKTIVLIIATGIVLISLGHLTSTLVSLINRQVFEYNTRILEHGIMCIEYQVGKIETLLRMVEYDQLKNLPVQQASGYLQRLQQNYPEVRNIWIASPDKQIIIASDPALIGQKVIGPEGDSQPVSGQKAILVDFVKIPWAEKPEINIMLPLFQGNDYQGSVGASVKLETLGDTLQDVVRPEQNMVMTIMHKRGMVIASSSASIQPGTPVTEGVTVETATGEVGSRKSYSPVFRDERFYVQEILPGGYGLLLLSQPAKDAYGPWMRMVWNGVPLILIFAVLMIVLAYQVIKLEKTRILEAHEYQTEKNHAVAELAASMAHEVRNPITAIRGFMQLLCNGGTDGKAHEYAQQIVEEVDAVEAIIGEYLNMAKPDQGKQEKCNLYHVLQNVYTLAQSRAECNSVQVDFDVVSKCMVLGDDRQLKQAFLNLCANAIQAMPKGGRLRISAACAENKVVVRIADNGQGIPTNHLNRLGERFFTTRDNGSGLGLAVTCRIVKKHRGEIHVVSSEGQGTEFIIILPAYHQDAA